MNTFEQLQFGSSLVLWFWPLTAAILWWLVRYVNLREPGSSLYNRLSGQFRHPRVALLRQFYSRSAVTEGASFRRWSAYALFAAGIHLTLAQPYYQGQQLPEPPRYRDTVFIIDSSVSMVLKDYQLDQQRVDRMTMLKSVMQHLIRRLQGNRIGIITFSEQTNTLVPLTADYNLLQYQLQRLVPARLTGRTSHPGQALIYTLQTLQDRVTDQHKPVLVLVSDVNRPDRHVDPRAAAEYIANQGYHLHVIGIGGASYAAADQLQGGLIYHPSNFALLKAIAERGNGRFYWAKNTDSLKQAILAIQSSEQHRVDSEPRYIPITLYHWPLLFSLIWLAVLYLLTQWRRLPS